MKGNLTAVVGPMFAGKSKWLINHIKAVRAYGAECFVYKPATDTRTGMEIRSRNGEWTGAMPIKRPESFYNLIGQTPTGTTIVIDEIHLFDTNIVGAILHMLNVGFNVVVGGLDLDYKTRPFAVTALLMTYADEVVRIFAACDCGIDAEYTQRLVQSDERIVIGDSEYAPKCRACYQPPAGVQFVYEEMQQ